jgi:hypothetical protein
MTYALVALVAYVVGHAAGKTAGFNKCCRKLREDREYRKTWESYWQGEVW